MQTLFIDFDGTICHDRFWQALPSDEYQKISTLLFSGGNQRVVDWMLGKYTAEEITQYVSHETGLDYQYLWSELEAGCSNMHIESELLQIIQQLRNRFHVVLITGNMDTFSRFTIPSLELNKHFDVIVNSFDVQALKTDNNGLQFIKHSHSNDVSRDFLVEDSVNSCKCFKKLGGTALQVTHETPTLTHLEGLLKI